MLKYYVAVVLGILASLSAEAAPRKGFSFSTGFGYDLLSAQYFVDSLRFSGSDTVLTRWELSTDYLNDFKGRLEMNYRYEEASKFDLKSTYEQTPDVLRFKTNSDWRTDLPIGRWQLRSSLDWREQYRDEDQALGSYVAGAATARLRSSLASGLTLLSQFSGDITEFYAGVTGYDYYRMGGKLGLEQAIGLLSTVSVDGFFMRREVADSQSLDYDSYGGELAFFGSFGSNDLDLLTRWETKDYNRPGSVDDFDRLEINGRNRLTFGRRFVTRQMLDVEMAWYDPSDLLNNSYRLWELTFLGGLTLGDFEFGVGPDLEILRETNADTSFAEDYFESAGRLDVTCITASGLFLSLESRLGFRQLDYPNEYQSDFTFYDMTILGDATFWGTIHANLLLSAEWQWYDLERLDNRTLLISTSVGYKF